MRLGYEDLFNLDLNQDSIIGPLPVVDANSDGLVDGASSYQLVNSDGGGAVTLTNRGIEFSDATSPFWDVIAARSIETGYQVLAEGDGRYEGKYLVWSSDPLGAISGSSGWKTEDQAMELGYEEMFGVTFNPNDDIA